MATSDQPRESIPQRRSSFATTQWPLVRAAGDEESPDARGALATLCETYWYPLYAFVRRRGHDSSAAEDLTQGFFAFLLEKDSLKAADRERGRFRSFLLASLKNFLTNEWNRERAQKRGGGQAILSLELARAEGQLQLEPADDRTPEDTFDQRWASTQLARVITRLGDEMSDSGQDERFERLKGFLTGNSESIPHREVAEQLGMSETAVKVAVHRMRRRFGELLRAEIAETLENPDRVEEEIRHLFAALDS